MGSSGESRSGAALGEDARPVQADAVGELLLDLRVALQARGGHRREPAAVARITSYNVCYTKLLRDRECT